MTLSVSLSPEVEAKLRARAAAVGKEPAMLAAQLVEQGVNDSSEGASEATGGVDRQKALEEWMASARRRAGRYARGFVADDGREGIYQGRGE